VRPAITPAQHRLRGTKPEATRLPAEKPAKPIGARTPPPRWLPSEARVVWRELVRVLPADLAGEADAGALANLATMLADYRQMGHQLVQMATLLENSETGAVSLNPLIRARQGLLVHIRQSQAEFGLTPRSRAQLAAVGAISIRPADTHEDEARADVQRQKQQARYSDLAARYKPKLVPTA
jgi:P27 family predicted phage terminase small subunit